PSRRRWSAALISIGVVLAAISATAIVLASRPRSVVSRRLAQLVPPAETPRLLRSLLVTRELAQSGLGWREADLVRAKIVGALLAAALAAVVGLFAPIGPLVLFAAAYTGFILPTLHVDRIAAQRRSE